MSGNGRRDRADLTRLRQRRLDPGTLSFVVGMSHLWMGVGFLVTPRLIRFVLGISGFEAHWLPLTLGIASIIAGTILVQWHYWRVKVNTLLFSVAFWLFVTLNLLVASPGELLFTTPLSICFLLLAIITYWRSWIWR